MRDYKNLLVEIKASTYIKKEDFRIFLTYATSIRAPFVALPILKLF